MALAKQILGLKMPESNNLLSRGKLQVNPLNATPQHCRGAIWKYKRKMGNGKGGIWRGQPWDFPVESGEPSVPFLRMPSLPNSGRITWQ